MKNSPQTMPAHVLSSVQHSIGQLLKQRQVRWGSVLLLVLLSGVLWQGRMWRTVKAQTISFNINTVVGSSSTSGLVADLRSARGVAAVSNTEFYIADAGNHVIRKVNVTTNSVTVIAGKLGVASTNSTDTNGDGGPATSATLNSPYDVVVDQAGNLYISDTGNRRIRKVSVSDGTIQTVIGNGNAGSASGVANGPVLSEPRGMALNTDTLYLADSANNTVVQVDGLSALTPASASSTPVLVIAGTGVAGVDGDGGLATLANLNGPRDVAISGNNLFIADSGNHKIRLVTKNAQNNNFIETFAGTGVPGFNGDGAAANSQLNSPLSVVADATRVYVSDSSNNRLRQVEIGDRTITTIAGNGQQSYSGEGSPATSLSLNAPSGIIISNNTLVFLDTGNRRLRRVSATTLSTIVSDGSGGSEGDGGLATTAKLDAPAQVIADNAGNYYIADTNNHVIRKVSTIVNNGVNQRIITRIAGSTGMMSVDPKGVNGDGGDAILATLSFPSAIALDSGGNLFIADTGNQRIRKVGTNGKISTVAGVVGTDATSALGALVQPTGVAVDSSSNLYIADAGQHVVFAQNSIGSGRTFIAGKVGISGSSGDGGLAENARLNRPTAVSVISNSVVYIADTNNHRIRKVEKINDVWQISSAVPQSSGTVQIIPRPGFDGDGLPVNGATRLTSPTGVAADSTGTLYIVDRGNNRIRRVDGATKVINTVIGNGDIGFSGDGGPAISAALGLPLSIAMVPNSNPLELLLADTGNNRIRRTVEPENVAPVLTSPGNKTVNEGAALAFTVAASDANAGQTLTYSMSSTPTLPTDPPANAATLNSSTGAFSFTPSFTVAPNQPNGSAVFTVTFTVTDNGSPQKSDSKTITITVNNVNGKPVVDSGTIPSTVEATGPSGAAVPLTATATDPDGDPLTYLWTDTRPGQQPQTIGTQLSINPTLALGQHSLIFMATDGSQNSATTTAKTLTVQDTTKPAFTPATMADISETITSGNSKVVTFTLPTANDLVSGARPVTAQPASGSTFPVGVTTVTVSASDAAGNTAQLTFKVTVTCTGTNCSGNGGGDPNVTNYNIYALAGNAGFGTSGDGGNATAATFKEPRGVAVDSTGNIYIADQEAHAIRRVTTQGSIALFAGAGKGFAGDGGVVTSARFNSPTGLAIDATRNVLYVADTGNHRIRRIDLANNTITTLAGTGLAGLNADGVATSTQLNSPSAVAVDGGGAVYIADTGNNRLVRVSNGNATTFAGNGQVGNTGDSGAPAQAKLNHPTGVAVTSDGTVVYVVDRGNNRVRKISGGAITNFAGNGNAATSGDGALATAAGLNAPTDVMVDATGIVYISETDGERIRRVTTDGKIDTVAGNGVAGNTGDDGVATSATLNTPTALARNTTTGVLFLCDTGNLRVRRLVPSGSTNRPPVPEAIGNASLTKNQTLSLALSATDADGDSVTFTLVPAYSFVSVTNANAAARTATLFINPAGSNAGTYNVRVQATDSKGGTGLTPEFTITVTDPNNNPPVAIMNTLASTVFAPSGSSTATINLNGTGSSDPDGDPITYAWFDGATQIATGQVTTAQLGGGQHAIRLVVTDSKGASGSSAVQNVTVQLVTTGNRPPTARIKNLSPEVFSSTGVDAAVLLDGSDSTDPDNDPLTYEWYDGINKIATGMTATVNLAVSVQPHQIKLVVSDGISTSEAGPQEVLVSVTPPDIVITSVSPNTGKRGQSVTVTVNGRGFNSASYVTINGGGVTATMLTRSTTQLTVKLTITSSAAFGWRGVTVTNPSGGSGTLSNSFRIDAQ